MPIMIMALVGAVDTTHAVANLTAMSWPDVASIFKDLTLSVVLIWFIRSGVGAIRRREWVPGEYYVDALKRAEKAEDRAILAHDAADRAVQLSSQLLEYTKTGKVRG